jgi:hypothetical protein
MEWQTVTTTPANSCTVSLSPFLFGSAAAEWNLAAETGNVLKARSIEKCVFSAL